MKAAATQAPGAAPLLHMLGWFVAVALVAAALLPLAPQLVAAPAPLALEVSGDFRRIGPGPVQVAAAPLLEGPLHALDLVAIRQAVEDVPWVARARVERSWPSTVRVHVWEHDPVARWGDAALLSSDDRIFSAGGQWPAGLPRLSGPAARAQDVREAYAELHRALRGTPWVPVALALDPRGTWTAKTAEGLEFRFGHTDPAEAAPLLAGPVIEALNERRQEVAYVDLHYVNGFAVGWRDGPGRRPGSGDSETRHDLAATGHE